MTERSPNFIRSVEKLGRYSEEEAITEATALEEEIASGEAPDLSEAEKLVAKENIEQLLATGKVLEAVRLSYFTEKNTNDEFIVGAFNRLRQLMDAAETEDEFNRLDEEWTRLDKWRAGPF